MTNAGLSFRSTKDLDLVLIVEVLNVDFVKKFWEFIKDGEYENCSRKDGTPQFYRFSKPRSHDFPEMIELFARQNIDIALPAEAHVTRIGNDDEIFSLSAIILDNNYYTLLQHGNTIIDGVNFLDYPCIVPFKVRAWLDLNERKKEGGFVDSKDIKKHKNDVFRLLQLFTGGEKIDLSEAVKNDMRVFIDSMRDEEVDLKNLGIVEGASVDKDVMIDRLKKIYRL